MAGRRSADGDRVGESAAALRGPRGGGADDRTVAEQLAAALLHGALPSPSSRANWAPAGPTPSVYGCHHSSKVGEVTVTSSSASSMSRHPACSSSAASSPLRAPARATSSSASGITVSSARKNVDWGARPPSKSQTLTATTPPARVTRRNSPTPARRVAHEMHDQLGEGAIEGRVFERERLGRSLRHRDSGESLARRRDERLRWVDRGDGCRPQPVGQHLGERPGSAADIERQLARAQVEPVGELDRQGPGEPPHESVVRRRRHIERHARSLATGSRASTRCCFGRYSTDGRSCS